MAEYIEREHLKDKLSRYLNAPHVRGGYIIGQGMRVAIKSCIAMLDDETTADVEPVRHGRWEWLGPNSLAKECMCGTCSACKVRSKYIVNREICPNCGARMDLGGADNG